MCSAVCIVEGTVLAVDTQSFVTDMSKPNSVRLVAHSAAVTVISGWLMNASCTNVLVLS